MPDLSDLLDQGDLDAVEHWLAGHDARSIADELVRLPRPRQAVAFRLLDRDPALAVFEVLDPWHQSTVLQGLRDEAFADVLEAMAPDDRARLMGDLPAKVAKRALAGLSAQEREMTAGLLGYGPGSVGRAMTPEVVSLRATMTVESALAKVRRTGREAETVYTLPVTDDERHLVGVTSLRGLVLAPADAVVGDLMSADVHTVHADDDRVVAARLILEADLLALPVLDAEDRLVGVVTFDDAMEILEEEQTEDQSRLGAALPLDRPYLAASVLGVARSRALWLLILIAAAVLTVNVLQAFEDTLERVVTLAVFIPLLIGTGGNSGSQAATVVTRAMAVGEVQFRDLPSVVWREARVGLLLGAVLAAVGFGPVALFFDADIAVVISVTLLAICTWATFVGASLPMLARRVGVDPAVVSAPLVSTLVDATGLVIYLSVARLVLGL